LLGIWLIGEFGDMLTTGQITDAEEPIIITEDEIMDMMEGIMEDHHRKGGQSDIIIQYLLTGLGKLTVRLKNSNGRIQALIETQMESINAEIQQRACEYSNLFDEKWEGHRAGLFDAMPFAGDENMLVEGAKNRATLDDGEDSSKSTISMS
jgi:AP-1 complex subunit gamma-1